MMANMKLNKKTVGIIGWVGTVLLMLGYGVNTLGFIDSTGPLYAAINAIAGLCLGIRVFADRNWSNLVLEIFWIGIALISIIRYFFF